MKTAILFVLTAFHAGFGFAWGWGEYGHRIIGAVAEKYCLEETMKEIHSLVGDGNSLQSVASWADEIREKRKKTAKWHYVYIPKNRDTFTPERDCPKAGCIIAAIEHFQDVLIDTVSAKTEKEEALKFIVHLVGDLHQPLHCGYREDQGGNALQVLFLGRKTNLKKVWDRDILAQDELNFDDYLEKLSSRAHPDHIQDLMQGTVTEWALESRQLLLNYVYDFPPDRKLKTPYYVNNLAVVDHQLLKAGLRLAGILNRAFHR